MKQQAAPLPADEVIRRVLSSLQHAQERPDMYFRPIEPEYVFTWLWGLRTGLQAAGVSWHDCDWETPFAKRGIDYSTADVCDALMGTGLSPQQTALELLKIDEEVWRERLDRMSAEAPGGREEGLAR